MFFKAILKLQCKIVLKILYSDCLTFFFIYAAIVDEPEEEKEQENPEEDSRRNLAFLLEKVEGCSVSVIFFTFIFFLT